MARDFVAQFLPYELATLPEHCRPRKMRDSSDITEYAFAVVRHRCDDGDGATGTAHRLADFFSHAAVRLSQIHRTNAQTDTSDDDRQSA